MKIIAFSLGDSNDAATWSNVPYYTLKAFEKNGDEVIRVNIMPFKNSRLIRQLIGKAMVLTKEKTAFERTSLFKKIAEKKMLKAVKANPDADLLLTFDFSNSVADKADIKTLLLCDWDIKYLINQIDKREPTPFELELIEKQKEVIKSADYAVTIFPNAYSVMKEDYDNLYYFGTPINLDEPQFNIDEVLDYRFKAKKLLFIGKEKYLSGAKALAAAIESYNSKNEDKFYLNIIGMNESVTNIKSEYITHFDYLRKDVEEEWEIYSSILKESFFFINTTDNWVGASSVIDSAYLGIPCIINPNPDLTKTFGEELFFGYYCKENKAEAIEKVLKRISELTFEEYNLLSNNARVAVKGYTYDEYIKKLINLVNDGD